MRSPKIPICLVTILLLVCQGYAADSPEDMLREAQQLEKAGNLQRAIGAVGRQRKAPKRQATSNMANIISRLPRMLAFSCSQAQSIAASGSASSALA